MKFVMKERAEVTEEGIKDKILGLGAAAALATGAGAGMKHYTGQADKNMETVSQLQQANIPGPTMARGYLKVTGKEFSPVYGNYGMELQLAVADLINAGKLAIKDGKLIVTGK